MNSSFIFADTHRLQNCVNQMLNSLYSLGIFNHELYAKLKTKAEYDPQEASHAIGNYLKNVVTTR